MGVIGYNDRADLSVVVVRIHPWVSVLYVPTELYHMRFSVKTLLVTTVVVAAMISVPPLLFDYMIGFDRDMQHAFDRIELNCDKQAAIDLLGPEYSVSPYFSRALSGYESSLSQSAMSESIEFLTWRNGGNWFYCIGVDADGGITLKSDGHS